MRSHMNLSLGCVGIIERERMGRRRGYGRDKKRERPKQRDDRKQKKEKRRKSKNKPHGDAARKKKEKSPNV